MYTYPTLEYKLLGVGNPPKPETITYLTPEEFTNEVSSLQNIYTGITISDSEFFERTLSPEKYHQWLQEFKAPMEDPKNIIRKNQLAHSQLVELSSNVTKFDLDYSRPTTITLRVTKENGDISFVNVFYEHSQYKKLVSRKHLPFTRGHSELSFLQLIAGKPIGFKAEFTYAESSCTYTKETVTLEILNIIQR